MLMKQKGLNIILAVGVACTQTFALANPTEPAAFHESFQTIASYMTEGSDGSLTVSIPSEIVETLDPILYQDLLDSLESYNASLSANEPGSEQLRIPFAKKLVIIGLKHGGPVVKKIVSKVSPKAGQWLGKYADKLAKFLEDLENWAELPIITYLVKNGVPPADAKIMAEIIVALL